MQAQNSVFHPRARGTNEVPAWDFFGFWSAPRASGREAAGFGETAAGFVLPTGAWAHGPGIALRPMSFGKRFTATQSHPKATPRLPQGYLEAPGVAYSEPGHPQAGTVARQGWSARPGGLLVKLGRRNLPLQVLSVLRGRLYNRKKQRHGGQLPKGSGQNVHSVEKTAELLAKEHGVSEKTIRRDGKRAEATPRPPRGHLVANR